MKSIFVIMVTRDPGRRDFEHTYPLGFVFTERQAIDLVEEAAHLDDYNDCVLDFEELESLV